MFAEVDGITTRYEKVGSGSPVIVLHGWGGAIESVRPIIQCLSRTHTAYALDFPGFGQSKQPPADWGIFDYAEWVGTFMDIIQCPQAHLIGHSFGGRVAIVLAAQHSHRINRLILVDSAGIRSPRTWRHHLRVNLFKGTRGLSRLIPVPRWQEAALKQMYAIFGSTDYRDAGPMRGIFVRVVNEDLQALLPAIQAASLLIWGENDGDVPLSHGEIMAREMPNAHLEVLSGAGHFSYLDRLPKFCRLVQDFLEEKSD